MQPIEVSVIFMGIKVVFKNEVLEPLEKLNLKEGEEIEVEVSRGMTKRLVGIVKCYEGLEEVHEEYEFDIHRC